MEVLKWHILSDLPLEEICHPFLRLEAIVRLQPTSHHRIIRKMYNACSVTHCDLVEIGLMMQQSGCTAQILTTEEININNKCTAILLL